MKGLLYREFCITKKTCRLMLGVTTLFVGLSFLVLFSMEYGNLRYVGLEIAEFEAMFIYTVAIISILIVEAANQAIYSDYAVNWMKLSYCLPISPGKVVGLRYVYGLILLGCSTVYIFLYIGILGITMDFILETKLIKTIIVILLLGIIYMLVDIPLAFRYKTAQAVGNKLGIVLIVLYVIIGANIISKMKDMSVDVFDRYIEKLMNKISSVVDTLLLFSPLIILVLFAVSFYLSKRFYQRREK